jgi:hypothetical protein
MVEQGAIGCMALIQPAESGMTLTNWGLRLPLLGAVVNDLLSIVVARGSAPSSICQSGRDPAEFSRRLA